LRIAVRTDATLFDVVVDIHTRGMVDDENNLAEFIREIAIGCNLAGITREEAKRLIAERCNTEESTVSATVNSLYREHENDYASKSLKYNLQVRSNDDEEDWLKMPYLPNEVFAKLPPILQHAVSVFPDKRDRDVFFTGALAVLSGLFPQVHGIYQGRTVYPNLYCFVVAPAASNKGNMVFAKELGMPFHLTDNDKLLFLPADTSAAALYQELELNEGTGIFFETEADTMTESFKQEWGKYSDSLRKAFHHEHISIKRKDAGRARSSYTAIPTPKLSITLSGTPNQVKGIIPDAENGLLSRFLFYMFRSEPVWKDNTNNESSLDDFFKGFAEEMRTIVNNLTSIEKFDFTPEQWQIFDARFRAWQSECILFYPEESLSIIRRMGLITFRIAMIISLMRKGSASDNNNNNESESILYCQNIDFYLAFYLTATYIQHSLYMFGFLNKGGTKQSVVDRKIQQFFDTLPPDEFTRAAAVQAGKDNVNLEERTVDKYLKKLLVTGHLIQDNYGKYRKR